MTTLLGDGRLGPGQRTEALRRMERERFDIVVIGGGVVGCGAALDAASRGLSVALVEARDYAAGTSSRSSKLLHGGLRYLEQAQLPLVREALHERDLMLERLCPHLARPVPFLIPLERPGADRAYLGAGAALYDLLARSRAVPRHRHLTRRGALRLAPALRPDGLAGGILLHDGQVDDARHTVTLARTAARHGAVLAPSARATGFLRAGERITGVRVRDLESAREIDVRGRIVLNAAGVWTDELQSLLGGRGRFRVRASKGVHLVVPRDRIQADAGLLLRTPTSVLFVIPWGWRWLIGTTDTAWNLDLAHPAATRADIDYLLERVNRILRSPLTTDDVTGVYAGLRPLLAGETDETSRLSREHSVASPAPGLVAVAGGKYTTYRIMARDAVDAAARGMDLTVAPSCTEQLPLIGADGWRGLMNARERMADGAGLHVARIEHLLQRFGSETAALLDLMQERPELAEPIDGAETYLRAEALWAVTHEGALHLDDVLTRRTRISIETWDRGLAAAEPAARLMAEALDWDDGDVRREVEHYRARVEAERRSQEEPSDETADSARLAAPDSRLAAC
jgi:glycerol-3-phosphate dehydrogenase